MPLLPARSERAEAGSTTQVLTRVWLVADDLTGACDAGAAFLKAGMGVRVWLGPRASFAAPEAVQAINTESRSLPAESAARAVAEAVAVLPRDGGTLLFKKIDSALRGPVAAELLAGQRALSARAILLAPAFPATGRTVTAGVLQAADVSGSRRQIRIRDLFSPDLGDGVAEISNPTQLAAAYHAGKMVLICDSASQQDLDAYAHAAQSLPGLLYAGSAGLARAIAGLHVSHASPASLPAGARALVICGTAHPVTELQLEAIDRVRFPDVKLLRIRCESGDEARVRAEFTCCDPQALVLTGGETALLVLRELGAQSLVLRGECAPGIPWGTVQGGAADGRLIVTKSGGFGAVSAMNDILTLLAGTA